MFEALQSTTTGNQESIEDFGHRLEAQQELATSVEERQSKSKLEIQCPAKIPLPQNEVLSNQAVHSFQLSIIKYELEKLIPTKYNRTKKLILALIDSLLGSLALNIRMHLQKV